MDTHLLREVWDERAVRPVRFDQVARRHFGEMLQRIEEAEYLPARKSAFERLRIANTALCYIACGGKSSELAKVAVEALEHMNEVANTLRLNNYQEGSYP